MLLLFDLDDTLFRRLPDNYTLEQLQGITVFDGVYEFLKRQDIVKVLVSKGDPLQQRAKIKILKLEPYFDLILICSTDSEKKACFQQAHQRFPRDQVWVIGDRIDSELRWGKELGFKTIRCRQGKYKDLIPRNQFEFPDYEISSFKELPQILGLS